MTDATSPFDATLLDALAGWNVVPDAAQLSKLRAHFEATVEANTRFNLTRITDAVDAAVKHYADSLALLGWVEHCGITVKNVLDVGTGAGFPAVPLAVMRPNWTVTAIDGTRKKIDFVRASSEALALTNLRCEHAHSTDWKTRRSFDLVLFRALARLTKGLAQTAGYCRKGGFVIAYRSPTESESMDFATLDLCARLHLTEVESYPYELELKHERLSRVLKVFHRA